MSRTKKRNASEAFEAGTDGTEATKKRHKKRQSKHQRTEISDHDDAAAQLQRESQQSSTEPAPATAAEQTAEPSQQERKSRKRKKKDKAAKDVAPEQIGDAVDTGSPAIHFEADTLDHDAFDGLTKKEKKMMIKKAKKQRKLEEQTAESASTPTQEMEPQGVQSPTASEPALARQEVLVDKVEHGEHEKISEGQRKKLRKKSSLARHSSAGLAGRISRSQDVDPEDVVTVPEDASTSSGEVAAAARTVHTNALQNRIEAAPIPKRRRKSKTKALQDEAGWSLSDSTAGSFLDQDPLLTDDDQFLILPTRNEIRIYSTSTSLLVRTLPLGRRKVCSCVISKSTPSRLLVGTTDGRITTFDWTRGRPGQDWKSSKGLQSLVAMSSRGPRKEELVMAMHSGAEESRMSILALDPETKEAKTLQVLISRPLLNADVQLFEEAGIILASSGRRLIIGSSSGLQVSNYTQSAVTWREFTLPDKPTSVDGRIVDVQEKPVRKRLDVVVGLKTGSIVLYEDLLYKFIGKEKKVGAPIAGRFLNWHREAVNTVKWSRDGNYLISGGSETVLLIWQLDTNKQQYLPHLSTDVLRLNVSRDGSSYALLLADNSVMVLSTSDLKPTTNIALLATARNGIGRVAAAIDPSKSGHVIISVPRATSLMDEASVLQTYDFLSDLQISRQALTRTLTTTVNIGPEGQSIREPNTAHLDISFDGKWLMTVEQWRSPAQDMNGVLLEDEKDSRDRQAETTFRFWIRNEDENDWELVNRVDQPHDSHKVFAISHNPSHVEFASTASDGVILYWTPKARKRDGVSVRDQKGRQLYNWAVSRSITCLPTTKISAAALSYSQDGSVVAASYMTSGSPQWTYLIENTAKAPSHYMTGLFHSGEENANIDTAFVDQYLLTTTSSTLTIYDSIDSTLLKSITFPEEYDLRGKQKCHLLAANPLDGTFALAMNPADETGRAKIFVFDLRNGFNTSNVGSGTDETSSDELFVARFKSSFTCLFASPTSPGYVVIDGNSEIRQVRGVSSVISKSRPGVNSYKAGSFKGLDAIFGGSGLGSRKTIDPPAATSITAGTDAMDIDTAADNTASSSLQGIFNQDPTQTPTVSSLFERIVGLFKKPHVPLEETLNDRTQQQALAST